MTGPSGKPFNYSDAGGGGGRQPAMFWFANKQNNPSLLWVGKPAPYQSAPITRWRSPAASHHVVERRNPHG